jgi:alpha-N-arabinofuranosidase
VPVTFNDDGWFTSGDGTAPLIVETDRIPESVKQTFQKSYTFENTLWNKDWQFLRTYKKDNYIFEKDIFKIKSTVDTLDTQAAMPAFIGLHQKEFDMEVSVNVKTVDGEAGVTIYMDENHHYDLALVKTGDEYKVVLKLNIGDIKHERASISITQPSAQLKILSNAFNYTFIYIENGKETVLGTGQTKYLSSEVAGGFTGVLVGLYSQNGKDGFNEFTNFECIYPKI